MNPRVDHQPPGDRDGRENDVEHEPSLLVSSFFSHRHDTRLVRVIDRQHRRSTRLENAQRPPPPPPLPPPPAEYLNRRR